MVSFERHSSAAGASPAVVEDERSETDAWRRDRTVLVTGASGFVGMHACRELSRRGWRIRALVRNRPKAVHRLAAVHPELVMGDVRDAAALSAALHDVDAVLHLAAIAIERPGQSYEEVNTAATTTLLDAARAAGVGRLLHMSQNGASSTSPFRFLRSKGAAEDRVRESGLGWTIFRPSVIFGPEDEFVNVLARLVRLSPVIYPLPGGGTARFQPVFVDDVARAIGVVLDGTDTHGETVALGGPEVLTLRQMTQRVLVAMKTKRLLVGVPVPAIRPLVALAQRILPNPPVTTSLLDLLELDNTTGDTTPWPGLGLVPTPFTPRQLSYLEKIGVADAIRSMTSPSGG